ncbi:hypothetical protein BKA82DRAFT_922290 [Pisolithus tinctorius]|uniref:C2H2-type domain-containing protein n=1 Tax=Pisolithus tinctorius Marx 270 TaxID=870435 RepID=A0A0C3NNW8_PISTI|nr:hypothetical protein BKA82DRAFT_922290 [Pisolithus tinctorius]KIN97003.1 hypothetical protein M404DRAFT_922290 [Pisolithus tinctorius Marx 270]
MTVPWSQQDHGADNALEPPVCPWVIGCTIPLEDSTGTVYAHLRTHGFIRRHTDRAPCPWPLCPQEMQWRNVARHILERHIQVRVQCTICGNIYTRNETLQAHMYVCMETYFNAMLAEDHQSN